MQVFRLRSKQADVERGIVLRKAAPHISPCFEASRKTPTEIVWYQSSWVNVQVGDDTRETELNFRGVRSASGTLMLNSFSSSPMTSVRAKESRIPESNRDSSGSISTLLPVTRLMISVTLAGLSIGNLWGNA